MAVTGFHALNGKIPDIGAGRPAASASFKAWAKVSEKAFNPTMCEDKIPKTGLTVRTSPMRLMP
ncbi:MAG: hypothetical protein V8R49_03935 [Duodenibacillus massiliensis]